MVARQLRVEARFGCCRCGFPFFQYHHIVPWAVDQHYRPEDMVILCPNCHDMATKGALSEKEQRGFKARPHNARKGYAAGFLKLPSAAPALNLGGNVFVNDGTVLAFKGIPVLSVGVNEQGGLQLSLVLEDREGRSLAIVENNEWISDATSTWDLETGYRHFRLRERKRRIVLEIDGRRWPVIVRAHLWKDGTRIFVGPNGLAFGGEQRSIEWQNITFASMHFSVEEFNEDGPEGGHLRVGRIPNPKYGVGKLWSGTDPEVIEEAVEYLAKLKDGAELKKPGIEAPSL